MSAITIVGGTQIITLAPRRLVVGIRLQGTIGHIDPQNPLHIRARPYLRYLGETLRRLKCDVTVVLPAAGIDAAPMMKAFAHHDFPAPFRYVVDAAPKMSIGSGHGNKKGSLAAVNYGNFFQIIAEDVGSDQTRVLFIDTEVNYRYNPTQTLILEEYEPLTHRQVRQLVRGELEMTPEQVARYGLQSHHAARRQRHVLTVAEEIEKVRHSTDLLTSEMRETKAQATASELTGGGSGRWLGRKGGPRAGETTDGPDGAAPPLSGLAKREDAARRNRDLRVQQVVAKSGAPLATDGVHLDWRVRGVESDGREGTTHGSRDGASASGAEPGDGAPGATTSSSSSSSSSAAAKSVAINLEDYTLVALAEMVAEIAASDTRVSDYLKMEPLIEKLRVPNHGSAFYLPIENCDYMDLLNWDDIQVQERRAREESEVPDVDETEEHKDFFQ